MDRGAQLLPDSVTTPRLRLRRWDEADAPALSAAVAASLDHLRPWMSWAADEPLTPEARVELIRSFRAGWAAGGDAVYGAFTADGEVAGGCGLHRRGGPEVVEIGYWIHAARTCRGYATELARGLTTAAFTVAGIERVEIHHDRANVHSRAVPERLGFRFVREEPGVVDAPAEEGVDLTWAVTRDEWAG